MNRLPLNAAQKVALRTVLFCSVALSAQAQETTDWSAFAVPAVEAERNGPLADETFALVKQGGPWHQIEASRDGVLERELMRLLQQRQWADAMAYLKKANPDINVKEPVTGATPLTLAAAAGQLDLVRELMRRGAELDRVGAAGWTPLAAAVVKGHELVARDLLRKGARVDVPSASGQLPLHLACATGQLRLIDLLIAQGADWRAYNRQGRHAMAEAALFGQVPAMQALARAGAVYAEPDRHRLNAVHAAALGEQRDALAFLRAQHVAVPSVLSQVLIDRLDAPQP